MNDHTNDDTDLVELRALKITFKLTEILCSASEMLPERRDFVTSEIGQGNEEGGYDADGDDDALVVITFDSFISGDTAIRRLKEVIRYINKNGLPPPTLYVPRKTAELFKQLEREEPDLAEEEFLYLEYTRPNFAKYHK